MTVKGFTRSRVYGFTRLKTETLDLGSRKPGAERFGLFYFNVAVATPPF